MARIRRTITTTPTPIGLTTTDRLHHRRRHPHITITITNGDLPSLLPQPEDPPDLELQPSVTVREAT